MKLAKITMTAAEAVAFAATNPTATFGLPGMKSLPFTAADWADGGAAQVAFVMAPLPGMLFKGVMTRKVAAATLVTATLATPTEGEKLRTCELGIEFSYNELAAALTEAGVDFSRAFPALPASSVSNLQHLAEVTDFGGTTEQFFNTIKHSCKHS